MLHLYYGSLGVFIWKCGSQLLKEAKYKEMSALSEAEKRKKVGQPKLHNFTTKILPVKI